MDFDVGARLKQVRTDRNLTQRSVAVAAGVTNGLISLIESNKSSPSVASLKKILSVFGMSLADFFDQGGVGSTGFVFRSQDLVEINPSRVFGALSPDDMKVLSLRRVPTGPSSKLSLMYEVYEPGADTGAEPYSHSGEEGGFVIEGALLLEVDGVVETLQSGDAYSFDSKRPHRFRNVGTVRCVVVSAGTPSTF